MQIPERQYRVLSPDTGDDPAALAKNGGSSMTYRLIQASELLNRLNTNQFHTTSMTNWMTPSFVANSTDYR